MLNRASKAAMKRIPKEQSAYQPGRGTSERTLPVKLLNETALVTDYVPVYTKLIYVSEAFENVCRNLLEKMCKCVMNVSFLSLGALTRPH